MRALVAAATQRALTSSCRCRAAGGARSRSLSRRGSAAARPLPPAPAAAAAAQAAEQPSRQEHAAFQSDYFNRKIAAVQASITPDVDAKLARLAAAIPGLSPASRVLDAGAGDGALIPHLQVGLRACAAATALFMLALAQQSRHLNAHAMRRRLRALPSFAPSALPAPAKAGSCPCGSAAACRHRA